MIVLPQLTVIPRFETATKNKLPEGNVVKTIWIGESKIEFCDDYVARTPEAIAQVQREFHAHGWDIVKILREQGVDI
ncbi:hypothetical protein [Paenibacillus graminis]|uniref:hypothetical protein n=1 Tax=Paenibacillus graminis TaxID=189425 RepID=UPI002DB8C3C5|nr:hypothetical protein [Paenibacillus graminis]MEC0167417.1 hypothetical protein [Paenibacillus graminis]